MVRCAWSVLIVLSIYKLRYLNTYSKLRYLNPYSLEPAAQPLIHKSSCPDNPFSKHCQALLLTRL